MEGHGKPLRGDHLEGVAGVDIGFRARHHVHVFRRCGVGLRRRQRRRGRAAFSAIGQAALEIGDQIGQPDSGGVIGRARRHFGIRPDRGDGGDDVLETVENTNQGRPQKDAVGHA